MLQLILGILAISIAAASGLIMVQQMGLTVAAQDQRENVRRLDAAAVAVEAALGNPGPDGVRFAPMANIQNGYAQLPSSLKVVKSTVSGSPFLYCPFAPNGATGNYNASINLPGGGAYRVREEGGLVVSSEDGPLTGTEFRPAAIIVAAGRRSSTPMSCSAVHIVGGKVVVDGGIARVVTSAPLATDARSTVTVSGDADINAALSGWVRQPPASMRIVLRSSVQVDPTVWASFTDAFSKKASSLSITASGPAIMNVGASDLVVLGSVEFANVSLAGGHVSIANGGEVVMSGQTGVVSPDISAISVANGGRLSIDGARVAIASKTDGIVSQGQVSIASSEIRSGGSGTVLGLMDQSRTAIRGSSIGAEGARPGAMAVAALGMAELVTDGSSSVFAGSGNVCWQSSATDFSFKYSGNGQGSTSAVTPDEAPTADPQGDDTVEAQWQASEAEKQARNNERRLARISNRSNLTCR